MINGFVPTVGSTFKIVNFNSGSGQFANVSGLAINSTEHFAVTYQSTDVILNVASECEQRRNIVTHTSPRITEARSLILTRFSEPKSAAPMYSEAKPFNSALSSAPK